MFTVLEFFLTVQTDIGADKAAAETKFWEEYILQKHKFMIAHTFEIEKFYELM